MTRAVRDRTAVIWLVAALVLAFVHRWVPESTWLMVHLVLLGALSHSAMVWSEHFTKVLLRTELDSRSEARFALFAAGALSVFVGKPSRIWVLVLLGAMAVAGAAGWHVVVILSALHLALPARFRKVVRYYVAAAVCLPVGAGFGAALAFGLPEMWHARLLAAHLTFNLFGWLGLTVIGTLVTFWPTLLRARMDDRAERLVAQALPIFLIAIAIGCVGALTGMRTVMAAALALYLAGLLWTGRAMLKPLKKRGLTEFAPASVAAGLVWAVVGFAFMAIKLAHSWQSFADSIFPLAGIFAVGFGLQILIGALTHLMPMAIGGGPAGSRAALAEFSRWGTWRLTVSNLGITLFLLPLPSWMRVAVSVLTLGAFALFLPFMVRGIRAAHAVKQGDDAVATPNPADSRTLIRPGQFVAATLALTVALSAGAAADPGALRAALNPLTGGILNAAPAGAAVPATGETTEVTVVANDMQFTPSSIDVPAGNRLVINLVNEDPLTSHDLVVADVRTSRIGPGKSAVLDAGVISASIQGWCSVAGHKQMGMTLDINAVGAGASAGQANADEGSNTTPDHPAGPVLADPDAELAGFVDPTLPPATSETVHKITLEITEKPLEVAPGVWQQRWTFNGKSVGPTLRGKVGDSFEVTLINHGTMGHSLDFHAGALSPDEPMRTIAPGQSLVYRFTAQRAGAWLYHCGSHPMATHIAAGMYGAVIIDPPGLDPVDHEYVFVQSEIYVGDTYDSPENAVEVNADKVIAEAPDFLAFNGIADQYLRHPIQIPAGSRVRVWLVDAGPTRAFPFHIVGGQFDTTWTEGAYSLRSGKDAFGNDDGGSQVLPLLAAQGGFVELTFPEAGNYTAINHAMIDGEKGARARFEVVEK